MARKKTTKHNKRADHPLGLPSVPPGLLVNFYIWEPIILFVLPGALLVPRRLWAVWSDPWKDWLLNKTDYISSKLTRMWSRGFIQWIDRIECVEGWYISSHGSKIIFFHSGPLSPLNEPSEDNNTSYPLSPPLSSFHWLLPPQPFWLQPIPHQAQPTKPCIELQTYYHVIPQTSNKLHCNPNCELLQPKETNNLDV